MHWSYVGGGRVPLEVDHKDMGTATGDRRRGRGNRGEEFAVGGP